jgi:hypothetical protein
LNATAAQRPLGVAMPNGPSIDGASSRLEDGDFANELIFQTLCRLSVDQHGNLNIIVIRNSEVFLAKQCRRSSRTSCESSRFQGVSSGICAIPQYYYGLITALLERIPVPGGVGMVFRAGWASDHENGFIADSNAVLYHLVRNVLD